jgi:hypothetical protein
MSTRELSDAEKATARDKEIHKKSPQIVIIKKYGKWNKGDRPTVLQWKADELVYLGVAKYEGFIEKIKKIVKNG